MKTDHIKKVLIDDTGRLCIYPENEKFMLVWRTATEVHWDDNGLFLYSPKPREWSYLEWFKHILKVAKEECYCELLLTHDTIWNNIPPDLREQLFME